MQLQECHVVSQLSLCPKALRIVNWVLDVCISLTISKRQSKSYTGFLHTYTYPVVGDNANQDSSGHVILCRASFYAISVYACAPLTVLRWRKGIITPPRFWISNFSPFFMKKCISHAKWYTSLQNINIITSTSSLGRRPCCTCYDQYNFTYSSSWHD